MVVSTTVMIGNALTPSSRPHTPPPHRISGDIEQTNSLVFSAASDCEISKDMYQSTSSSDSVSGMDLSTPSVNVNQ